MFNEKVEQLLDLMIELLPEFQNRRKGSMWKTMMMSFPQVFPEDRAEILLRIQQVILPDAGTAKPTKLQQVQERIAAKGKGSLTKRGRGTLEKLSSQENYECPDCPKKQTTGKALHPDTVKAKKAGRAERLGIIKVSKPERFKSAADVLERFESNPIAMLNFCRNYEIVTGNAQDADTLANIIFEMYRP